MQWFINQIVNNDTMFSRVNKITKKALCNYKKGRDYNTEKKIKLVDMYGTSSTF